MQRLDGQTGSAGCLDWSTGQGAQGIPTTLLPDRGSSTCHDMSIQLGGAHRGAGGRVEPVQAMQSLPLPVEGYGVSDLQGEVGSRVVSWGAALGQGSPAGASGLVQSHSLAPRGRAPTHGSGR